MPTDFSGDTGAYTDSAGAAELIGQRERSVRNHCMDGGVGFKASRPMGGLRWWVHIEGIKAYVAGDTGAVEDIRILVRKRILP